MTTSCIYIFLYLTDKCFKKTGLRHVRKIAESQRWREVTQAMSPSTGGEHTWACRMIVEGISASFGDLGSEHLGSFPHYSTIKTF